MAEIHDGLHHAFDTVFQKGRFQYFGGALRHAKVASRTMYVQVFSRKRSRRAQRVFAGPGFVGAQVHAFCPGTATGGQKSYAQRCQKTTTRSNRIIFRNAYSWATFHPAKFILDGFFRTDRRAVVTGDAAAIVHGLLLAVDAGCFAGSGTKTATVATFFVHLETEHGKPRNKTQNGSDRAEGVAKRSAVPPG